MVDRPVFSIKMLIIWEQVSTKSFWLSRVFKQEKISRSFSTQNKYIFWSATSSNFFSVSSFIFIPSESAKSGFSFAIFIASRLIFLTPFCMKASAFFYASLIFLRRFWFFERTTCSVVTSYSFFLVSELCVLLIFYNSIGDFIKSIRSTSDRYLSSVDHLTCSSVFFTRRLQIFVINFFSYFLSIWMILTSSLTDCCEYLCTYSII